MKEFIDQLEAEWRDHCAQNGTDVDGKPLDPHDALPDEVTRTRFVRVRRDRRVAPPFHWRDHPGPTGSPETSLTPEEREALAHEAKELCDEEAQRVEAVLQYKLIDDTASE